MAKTSRCMLWLAVGAFLAGTSATAGERATPTPAPTATASARPTPIVITNETLGQYSGRGHITEVATKTPTPGAAPHTGKRDPSLPFRWEDDKGVAPAPPLDASGRANDEAARDEAEERHYWRGLYEKQLELLGSIQEQIDGLDREIPALWRDFYARDDPMYRDGVIKPKLDEALGRRQRLEERLAQEEQRLPQILERARHAGSKPGWFRGLERPTPSQEATPRNEGVKPEDLGGVQVVEPDRS